MINSRNSISDYQDSTFERLMVNNTILNHQQRVNTDTILFILFIGGTCIKVSIWGSVQKYLQWKHNSSDN